MLSEQCERAGVDGGVFLERDRWTTYLSVHQHVGDRASLTNELEIVWKWSRLL